MANRRRKGGSSNRFSLLGLQNHCGCWLPPWNYKCLLLGRKVMTSPDSKWKSKDNFANKSLHSQSYCFPVVMYGCESWTIKKAEHRRTDAFELWCWRRLLRVCWIARWSNQSILREINLNTHWKDWCWSWSFNTLATWCKELTHWKRRRCWERLKAEGKEGGRGWDGWMASPIQWTWTWEKSGTW